jgi:hypothetical protein
LLILFTCSFSRCCWNMCWSWSVIKKGFIVTKLILYSSNLLQYRRCCWDDNSSWQEYSLMAVLCEAQSDDTNTTTKTNKKQNNKTKNKKGQFNITKIKTYFSFRSIQFNFYLDVVVRFVIVFVFVILILFLIWLFHYLYRYTNSKQKY